MDELNKHIDKIKEFCDRNRVKSLFAFGSITNNQFSINSDIDLVVNIDDDDPISYTDHYYRLKEQLENLFKRQIDLLEEKTIKNPFLKQEIDKSKVLVYAK